MTEVKAKTKAGAKWLDRGLMFSPYYYALCLTEKDFHAEMKRLKLPASVWPPFVPEGAGAVIHEFQNANGKLSAIICLGSTKGRTLAQVHAMLVHEGVHLWRYIRKAIGERKPSAEFEAYAVQNITQNLMDAYDKALLKTVKTKGQKT